MQINLIGDAKNCTECHALLPLDSFHNGQGAKGRYSKCKPCRAQRYDRQPKYKAQKAAYMRERRATDPVFVARYKELDKQPHRRYAKRDYQVFRQYGLTPFDLASMLEAQSHKCAGCLSTIDLGKLTHIDHDHKTNKIRGLLCNCCNIALGGARDNPETLQRLIRYLSKEGK